MITKTTILIFFILTFSFAYGQNTQVKKEIKITTTFDYYYSENEKLYLSRKGTPKRGTLITEYNQDGTEKGPSTAPFVRMFKLIKLDSIVTVSLDGISHQREFWSDSTFTDVFTYFASDLITRFRVSNNDTMQIEKLFNYKKDKSTLSTLEYGFYQRLLNFEQINNNNQEATTVITTYFKNGLTDTVRIYNDKKSNTRKTLVYNHDKKEWFVKEKVQSRKGKRVSWTTFYHDYHKMYFTTKTTTEFNKMGQPLKETAYDTYLKHIEKQSTYTYEYY